MKPAVDILCNHFTADNIRRNFLDNPAEVETFERTGLIGNLEGRTPENFVAYLDEAGVDKVLITAIQVWSHFEQRMSVRTEPEEIRDASRAAPDRILGLFGINPMRRMEGVAALERAVRDLGFKGAHIHPHGYDLPPDHAYYFPFYARCAELGVPVVLSMGHTLDMLPIETGRPIHLDKVALYFSDLKIVCTHTAWPWVEEAIALASKHPNVYMGTSAYAPKYWPPELVRFIDTRGRDKVMWGTDYPLIMHGRSLAEVEALGLREEAEAASRERGSGVRAGGMIGDGA